MNTMNTSQPVTKRLLSDKESKFIISCSKNKVTAFYRKTIKLSKYFLFSYRQNILDKFNICKKKQSKIDTYTELKYSMSFLNAKSF